MEREKYEKEQAEKQKQLALEVATYKERVNTELADKIKEVNEAGFGEAETKRLTDEYQKRAAIDIQVSEAAHADKISEYSDYLKSEEVLLNESFARRQRERRYRRLPRRSSRRLLVLLFHPICRRFSP